MKRQSKILVLGGQGMVGASILRELTRQGFTNVRSITRKDVDLLKQQDTYDFLKHSAPEYIFLAAAKVGGIQANNTFRADFILENLMIETNVFSSGLKLKIPNILFLGSSCIYPKKCPQPIKEEYLLTSPLEETNEPYAIAKIAGLKMAENINRQYGLNYISVMPSNLYGPNDNYHVENSHVIPGLIRRLDICMNNNEKEFKVWGTGNPRREFLYVDDLAGACIHIMKEQRKNIHLINIGAGTDISIKDLAFKIAKYMGFSGNIVFDTQYPDGTKQKLMDNSLINGLGWEPKTNLDEGLQKVIKEYKESNSTLRQ